MENKIIFLLVVILCLYLLFSEKGQQILKNITGLTVGTSGLDSSDAINKHFNTNPKADLSGNIGENAG